MLSDPRQVPQTKSRIANDMKAKYLLQVPRESKGRERERE